MTDQWYDVVVIGGGVGGMQVAIALADRGHRVALVEAHANLGGKLLGYAKLFPSFENAEQVVDELKNQLDSSGVAVFTNTKARDITENTQGYDVMIENADTPFHGRTIVLAYGFDFFDPTLKEEYGYNIIRGVYSSVDFEKMVKENSFSKYFGEKPQGFGFVHCVGSRDEKVKNNYCSKVCCITAIKQAIEIKEHYPSADVFCFYMDLRLHELFFEKLYKQAQKEYGIHFIRGKVSEVANSQQGKVAFKVEDTLLSRPLRIELDGLFLMVGIEAYKGKFPSLKLPLNEFDFVHPGIETLATQGERGIFFVGTTKGPRSIKETLQDATYVSMQVHNYLLNHGK